MYFAEVFNLILCKDNNDIQKIDEDYLRSLLISQEYIDNLPGDNEYFLFGNDEIIYMNNDLSLLRHNITHNTDDWIQNGKHTHACIFEVKEDEYMCPSEIIEFYDSDNPAEPSKRWKESSFYHSQKLNKDIMVESYIGIRGIWKGKKDALMEYFIE